jgi:hypothetical protein
MMIVRLTACLLVLFFSLFDTSPLWAHEGHAHVMGTVTAVNDEQLVVQTKSQQTVSILVDHNTRYRATSLTTSSETVQVGDRVVVEVTEEANSLRAAEVRYATVAPRTP